MERKGFHVCLCAENSNLHTKFKITIKFPLSFVFFVLSFEALLQRNGARSELTEYSVIDNVCLVDFVLVFFVCVHILFCLLFFRSCLLRIFDKLFTEENFSASLVW